MKAWFTGGITDPPRPTFTPNTWATMAAGTATPDALRRADGKHLVVGIKRDSQPDITADLARLGQGETPQRWKAKAVALKQWEGLEPDKLAYHVMFADGSELKRRGLRPGARLHSRRADADRQPPRRT